jgi:dipeptide/tripeptide permease
MRFQDAGERILLTLWVGGLWTVGYIAAPVLFASLDEPVLAGFLAGQMFTAVAYLSLVCGGGLLLFQLLRPSAGRRFHWRLWLIVAMLLLIAIGEFLVRPAMAAAAASEFARLHGIAQVVYLAVSLLGLALVGFGTRPQIDEV